MYTSALGVLTYLFVLGSRLISKLAHAARTRRPLRPLRFLHAYYYASVIAIAPAMLVGMLSIGGAGMIEIILVVVFIVAACVYIRKRLD